MELLRPGLATNAMQTQLHILLKSIPDVPDPESLRFKVGTILALIDKFPLGRRETSFTPRPISILVILTLAVLFKS